MADSKAADSDARGYWRSLGELAQSEEFLRHLEAEFPGEASPVDGVSRRRFLQLMSASVALAGLAGCRWPVEEIVPFGQRPPGIDPGRTRAYATALERAGVAFPVLATSYDGRPIKIEGNPEHPLSLGAADALSQAAVLELYDPDRSQRILRDGRGVDPSQLLARLRRLRAELGQGEGLVVLSAASGSLPLEAERRRLAQTLPAAAWLEHEPLNSDAEAEGIALLTGRPGRARYRLGAARVVVDLDADLLHAHPAALAHARAWAEGRRPTADRYDRLYVFESSPSVTGSMADHRVPLAADGIRHVLRVLADELSHHSLRVPQALPALGDLPPVGAAEAALGERRVTVRALARDLLAHPGEGLLAVGPRQPAELHAMVHGLNAALGHLGRAVELLPAPEAAGNAIPPQEFERRLDAGDVSALLILDGNPVHTAPPEMGLAERLPAIPFTLHLGLHRDETARRCAWHVPRAHGLESWDLLRDAHAGVCAQQPLIEPLYDGWTPAQLLAALLDGERPTAHRLARGAFDRLRGGSGVPGELDPAFETAWRTLLHDGFPNAARRPAGLSPRVAPELPGRLREILGAPAPALDAEHLELQLAVDPKLLDGRFANNGWLQELPDPMSKLTWDNVALLSVSLAEARGIGHGDVVRLERGERAVELPAFVMPGQAPWTVTANLGYGRTAAGRVGNGVGTDVGPLRSGTEPWGGAGLRLSRTGGRHALACTQDHHAIDTRGAAERARRIPSLVREGTLDDYRAHPDFAEHMGVHHPPLLSLWEEHSFDGHRWGMAVDLNTCLGCNACVIACQAENNIPVVGKDEVAVGREMHWLRVDRYFQGDPEEPRIAQQPVACMQCELAPCEQVCPVGATMHSTEGLNAMVYNRCVGTRYCSNNCPYKVRRFNYFNNQKDLSETEKMAYNPDVTVRSRGVMEKCTYCVQRIERARIEAKNEGRPLADGDIVPACAQTCPTQAIVFGDLADPQSRVGEQHGDERAYTLLTELNIKPRTAYLARVRNPNPELADAGGHAGSPGHAGEDGHEPTSGTHH